jgi:hypothetical protein
LAAAKDYLTILPQPFLFPQDWFGISELRTT